MRAYRQVHDVLKGWSLPSVVRLIACGNVWAIFNFPAALAAQEFAVRLALFAGSLRLVRHCLLSDCLSLLGAWLDSVLHGSPFPLFTICRKNTIPRVKNCVTGKVLRPGRYATFTTVLSSAIAGTFCGQD